MRPSCRRYLCFLLAVCFIINEQESEGTAPCIIFREREKHASMGRASCNRKHCKLKGKDPVRGSDKYQYSLVFHVIKNTSRQCTAGKCLLVQLSLLPVCTVMLAFWAPVPSLRLRGLWWCTSVCGRRFQNLLVNRSPSQDVCVCVCAHLKWKFGI